MLRWENVAEPEPRAGELLVRVSAFALNWADILERRGHYPGAPQPPYVTGHDLAGVVAGHGPGVTEPPVGTPVFGVLPTAGAAAELVRAPASWLHPVPERLDQLSASAVAGPFLTADAAIVTMGGLRPGEDVLIHSAGGGFGSAAVQLCRAYGAGKIIATAGSPEKLERALGFGAHVGVDYHRDDFRAVTMRETAGCGVPLVLESVGGEVFDRSLDCLAPAGRLVSVGASAGRGSGRLRLQTLFELGISVAGFTLGHWIAEHPRLVEPSVQRVLRTLQRGTAVPVVGRVFPAGQAVEAHAHLEARRSIGKTVVRIS